MEVGVRAGGKAICVGIEKVWLMGKALFYISELRRSYLGHTAIVTPASHRIEWVWSACATRCLLMLRNTEPACQQQSGLPHYYR